MLTAAAIAPSPRRRSTATSRRPDRHTTGVSSGTPTDDLANAAFAPVDLPSDGGPVEGVPRGEPERRLMQAVLADALHIWLRDRWARGGSARLAWAEVDRWFRSTNRSWPFAFEAICEALDLDADRLRRVLRTHRYEALATVLEEARGVSRAADRGPRAVPRRRA